MGAIRIWLLGTVRIETDECPCGIRLGPSVQLLLAYLLIKRECLHHRSKLAGTFWGESSEAHARDSLNTALWRLRTALEPSGVPRGTYIRSTIGGEVAFNCDSDHWLDVAVFEEDIRRGAGLPTEAPELTQARALESALQLYRGDLLEGFFEDWVLRERERLRALYLKTLLTLLSWNSREGNYEQGIWCALKILEMDPLREAVHRKLMRMYAENGDRAMALKQYRICEEILADELGIAPMEETEALFGELSANARLSNGRVEHRVKTSRRGLITALNSLNQARREVRQAIEALDEANSSRCEDQRPSQA